MEQQGELDFEISFYENLLKNKPDFAEALVALGEAYTRKGRYEDGLQIDKRLAQLKPEDPSVYYNLACSYSLLKMADPSLEALKNAIRLGYRDTAFMDKDPDLDFIRRDRRYRELFLPIK